VHDGSVQDGWAGAIGTAPDRACGKAAKRTWTGPDGNGDRVGKSGSVQTMLALDGPTSEHHSLDACEGYMVEAARGRLGVVGSVELSLGAITVRRGGKSPLLVDLQEVAVIDAHDRRLVLRGSPRLRGTVPRTHP
jgi:hypothetical protein